MPGPRPALWGVLLFFAPAVAGAQLPLPNLGGESGPDVRLARDAFVDSIETFHTVINRKVETRKAANLQERQRLSRLEAQYDESLLPEAETTAPVDFDPLIAKRIIEVLDREELLLSQAADLAGSALARTELAVPARTGPANFDEVVELMTKAARLAAEADAADATAERLESLSTLEEEAADASLSEQLVSHEWRLQAAQVSRARASALEVRARSRAAQEEANSSRDRLAVSGLDAEAAIDRLTRINSEVAEAQQQLIEERKQIRSEPTPRRLDAETARNVRAAHRALLLSRLDLIKQKRTALEERALRAEARLVAMSALAEKRPPQWSPALSPARVLVRLAQVDQQRTTLDASMATLREQAEKLPATSVLRKSYEKRRRVNEEQLRILRERKIHLETMQVIQVTVRARRTAGGVGLEYAILLTLLVILCAILLMTYGLRWIHRLVLGESGRLKLSAKVAGRIDTAVALLWPLLVLGISAAVVVWPIWGLDVSFFEAINVIDTPLFYVDETPVSVVSVLQLLFAVWAAIVLSRTMRDFLVKRVYKNLGWDIGLTNALNTLVHYVVLLVGIVIGVRFVGIGASSFAILAGILGIGIGFGLRNITENFISGLIILAERPIKIGDFIEIDGEIEGRVESINGRSTRMITRDNVSLIIPNSDFVAQRVTNWSHGDPRVRIAVSVGVAYGSDTDLARRQLLEVAQRHNQVLKKPKPEVHFSAFGSSSLDFLLLVWVDEQQHRFRIASDLHFAIDKAFRKVNVEIAFPQLDLHLKSVSAQGAEALNPPLGVPATEIEPTTTTLDLPEAKAKGLPDGRSKGR